MKSEMIEFIKLNEGNRLFPYYPGIPYSKQRVRNSYVTYEIYKSKYASFLSTGAKSGVTISSGIDFGARSPSDTIFNNIQNATIREILKTACGLRYSEAIEWLWDHQDHCNISSNESNALLNHDLEKYRIPALRKLINNFDQLPSNIQTAAADISMNGLAHPYLKGAIPFFNNSDYIGLSRYLLNTKSGVDYTRRKRVSSLVLQSSSEVIVPATQAGNIDNYVVEQNPQNQSPNNIKGVAISNEIILSNYSNSADSKTFFGKLFKNSGLDDFEINALLNGLGVSDASITKYLADNKIELTNEKCEKILLNILAENTKRVENNLSLVLRDHPREVNTAIVSFIMDIDLTLEKNIGEISNTISTHLKSKNYDEIANVIEKYGEGKIETVKFKRVNEARLIRLRRSNTPNYLEEDGDGNDVSGDYLNNKGDDLSADVVSARNKIKNIREQRKLIRSNSTESSSSDEMYQEITKDVSDSFSDLMEKQQLITDRYMLEEESDYESRLRIVNLYSNSTRNYNKTYVQIEKELEDDPRNNTRKFKLNYAYSLFPYGSGLFYEIRENAVNRAKYRIKKLQYQVNEVMVKLIDSGVVEFINPLVPVTNNQSPLINQLNNEYVRLTILIYNESRNLGNLMAEVTRYMRSNTDR